MLAQIHVGMESGVVAVDQGISLVRSPCFHFWRFAGQAKRGSQDSGGGGISAFWIDVALIVQQIMFSFSAKKGGVKPQSRRGNLARDTMHLFDVQPRPR